MVTLKDKDHEEFRKLSEKEGVKYKSDLEMRQSADNLVNFIDLLVQMDMEERERKARLKDEPKGFSMPGKGRNCSLCGISVYETDGWYDKWGFKCMNCQDAVNRKKIPGSLCGDYKHEKSIPDTSLSYRSGLHIQTIRKLIRQGKIKARSIPNGPNMTLRKDNPNLLEILETESNE